MKLSSYREVGSNALLPIEASEEVLGALQQLDRTEDVKFSPSNKRLAITCYTRNSIALVEVELALDGEHPRVAVTALSELSSPFLSAPHGVEFLNEDTIVVANRRGHVAVLGLSPRGSAAAGGPQRFVPIALKPDRDFQLLSGPGSVAVALGSSGTEVLVCNNSGDTVTRHLVETEASGAPVVTHNEVLLRRWLEVPDAVAVSPDGRWIAVSNHHRHVVMVYERSSLLHERSDPCSVLRGVTYPHGLCFGPDGNRLFVADAGTPFVHVYDRSDELWRGVRYPSVAHRVLDDDAFQRGHFSSDEGGPKGLDIDRSGRVLAATSRYLPIAFFDVSELVGSSEADPDDALRLEYELNVMRETEARVRAAEGRIAKVRQSNAFRMTQPLRRRAYDAFPWLNKLR